MIPRAGNPKLHPRKVALLHVARRQLGLEDADYRSLLKTHGGVESAADLTYDGFDLVMIELGRLGFKSTSSRKGFGSRPGFASPAQIAVMRQLWEEYQGGDEVALNAWLTRFHHVSALRFVTAEKANAVLIALKAMVGRKRNGR